MMRSFAYATIVLAALPGVSAAQTGYADADCDVAWNDMILGYPDYTPMPEDSAEGGEAFVRFQSAAHLYATTADYIDGRTPDALGEDENALRLIATTLAVSERVVGCNVGPVLLGTAGPAFKEAFDRFDTAYSTEDRYELRLMYGEYE